MYYSSVRHDTERLKSFLSFCVTEDVLVPDVKLNDSSLSNTPSHTSGKILAVRVFGQPNFKFGQNKKKTFIRI